VEDVHNYIGFAIQQDDVSSDKHMCAIGRWRREPSLEVFGAGLEPFLEARREGTTPSKLFFQSGG
jgi:hypothetical protein